MRIRNRESRNFSEKKINEFYYVTLICSVTVVQTVVDFLKARSIETVPDALTTFGSFGDFRLFPEVKFPLREINLKPMMRFGCRVPIYARCK